MVTVFAFAPLQNILSNDATLILPTPALGVSYHIGSYYDNDDRDPQFSAIATEDNTFIQVFQANGDVFASATLQKGEMYQLIGPQFFSNYLSIVGWNVVASNPVALFSGTRCASIGGDFCDILYEQILPVSALGSSYVFCPTLTRPVGCDGPDTCAPDLLRIIGTEDDTNVVVAFPNRTFEQTLNKRGGAETYTSEPVILTANKPFYTFQYLISERGGDPQPGIGDPSLINIVPIEQYLDKYTILTPSTFEFDFVNIVLPVGATITIDGATVNEPCISAGILDGVQYCCMGASVSDGIHQVEGSQPFGLVVTGFDDDASYGYVGGARLNTVNP